MGSTATPLAPPSAAFELTEAAAARPSALQEDGTCLIHIIRPGRGLGKGSHYYPADMLRENAHVFSGWNVYIDHESAKARQAREGLPRSLRDLGGMIEEAWWDDSVPAQGRFGRGAVVGRLRPIGDLETVIKGLPEAAKFSIKARATDVREGIEEGHQVWVVEGIREDPPGSVDAVTIDGAGGKVAALLEAQGGNEQELREAAEQLQNGAREERDPSDVQESTGPAAEAGEGGGTVKELEEALRDPESAVSKRVKELAEEQAESLVESAVEKARGEFEERLTTEVEEARSEERAKAERTKVLHKLEAEAHTLIEGAELESDTLTSKLKKQFSIEESGEPTEDLDLFDRRDSEGKVEKTASEQLRESVEAEIEEARKVLAEAAPAQVTGQGAGGEGGDTPASKPKPKGKRFWREHLEESGVNPDEAFPTDESDAERSE